MHKLLASCVAITAMATAASATSLEPTRLTDDELDTITAGLNIDTPYLNVQTNCSNCIVYDTVSNGRKFSDAFAMVSNDDPDGPANGKVVASYAGPLHIVSAALANGTSPSAPFTPVQASSTVGDGSDPFSYFTQGAVAYAGVNNGTAATVAYNGPLGIVQAGAALAEGEAPYPHSVGADLYNPSLLSINGLGGNLVLPTGNGRQLQIEGRIAIGVPGL